VFDLVAGFVYSQVLQACVQLDLFEVLSAGPQPLPTLAQRFGLTEDAARRLLAAAVSLQLVEPRPGDRYGLGVLGAPLVGNRGITAMVEHHAALYADLRDPLALLRGTASSAALAGYWPYAEAESRGQSSGVAANQVAAYSALMSASQPLVADEILDACPLAGHRCLLDVGGGEGTFLLAVAERAPHLQLMLFDLPAVAERGRVRFETRGLGSRAQAHGGDFLRDPLPRGADIATLVRVVHDHDDREVLALLRAVRAALPDDGVLLLAEPMADTPGAEPMGDAYFGFYLLAMGRGRPRRVAELIALLAQAGFERARLLPNRMPLQTRVLHAHCRKP
jgi:demethylspheroidene O-methyltransferase